MPFKQPGRCSEPGCPELATDRGRCDTHKRKAWENRTPAATRYGQSGWATQELHHRVLREAEYRCYYCGGEGADRVDHIVAVSDGGSKTARGNLGAIHDEPCHAEKTQLENARRRAKRAALKAAGLG